VKKFTLTGVGLTVQEVYQIANDPQIKIDISADVKKQMQHSRSYIETRLAQGEVMYGVNTGFGAFSNVKISDAEIEILQKNLIRSHSSGIGEPFSPIQTRAMMLLRANTIARGHSGVRYEVIEKIVEFLNANLIPVIPSQGSVGASGDLAPLSHLALALIGEGEVWGEKKAILSTQQALGQKNVQPLLLKAKEGLSLINGCQVMTAIGMLAVYEAMQLLKLADIVGAMTIESMRGSRSAFDPLISAARPHAGEIKTAKNLMQLLGRESEISKSHENCDRVQDPYSLRCMPAVHGAAKDALRYAWNALEREANASTDNPLVFADENKILSCGNFHGEPISMALDFAGIATSVLASISECRIAKLINPVFSQLPAFLTPQGGLNSGFMIVQVAAASLVSENKILAHPACVDSIPTSTDKEDHVSMGTIAARKFVSILQNSKQVIAMELMASAQAIDMLKLKPSQSLQVAFGELRSVISFAAEDRVFAHDIKLVMSKLIENHYLVTKVEQSAGELAW
jgi:histidine ammonia-lyase